MYTIYFSTRRGCMGGVPVYEIVYLKRYFEASKFGLLISGHPRRPWVPGSVTSLGTAVPYCTAVYTYVLYNWAKRNKKFLDSIWARWKCAQCIDLILGFLELLGDPPGNKNSESYGLPSPSLGLARATSSQGVFDHNWAFWPHRNTDGQDLYGTLQSVVQKYRSTSAKKGHVVP